MHEDLEETVNDDRYQLRRARPVPDEDAGATHRCRRTHPFGVAVVRTHLPAPRVPNPK
jgi:hypothetical protein